MAAKPISLRRGKMALRAGLRALDHEEAVLDKLVRVRVAEAVDDPRPPMPIDRAFAQVRASIAKG